jgi:D-lactate dehydrogenase
MLANQYGLLETAARSGIRLLASLNNIGGFHVVQKISGMLHRIVPGVPRWMNHVKGVGNWKGRLAHFPDAVYFTSCINRIMQASDVPLQLSMHELADKAGVKLHSPDNIAGKCCGQPFSSKGYFDAGKKLEARLIDVMLEWTDNGRIPVVCDFTSCTYTMFNNVKHLPEAYQQKMKQLKLMDSIDFIEQYLLPKLKVNNKADKVAIHPTCAAIKLNLAEPLEKIARAAAGEVIKPAYAGCCGMAGDRGFQVPALTTAATKLELQELQGQSLHGCYSSASTCQIALSENSGLPYEHIAVLLNEVAVKAE